MPIVDSLKYSFSSSGFLHYEQLSARTTNLSCKLVENMYCSWALWDKSQMPSLFF